MVECTIRMNFVWGSGKQPASLTLLNLLLASLKCCDRNCRLFRRCHQSMSRNIIVTSQVTEKLSDNGSSAKHCMRPDNLRSRGVDNRSHNTERNDADCPFPSFSHSGLTACAIEWFGNRGQGCGAFLPVPGSLCNAAGSVRAGNTGRDSFCIMIRSLAKPLYPNEALPV